MSTKNNLIKYTVAASATCAMNVSHGATVINFDDLSAGGLGSYIAIDFSCDPLGAQAHLYVYDTDASSFLPDGGSKALPAGFSPDAKVAARFNKIKITGFGKGNTSFLENSSSSSSNIADITGNALLMDAAAPAPSSGKFDSFVNVYPASDTGSAIIGFRFAEGDFGKEGPSDGDYKYGWMSLSGISANSVTLSQIGMVVPEPSTGLLCLAAGGAALLRRNRKAA